MILYVNGNGHSSGAEVVNQYKFACDDPMLEMMDTLPHPDNIKMSWGMKLSELLKYGFQCDAQADRCDVEVMNTTKEWIESTKTRYSDLLVVIGFNDDSCVDEMKTWLDAKCIKHMIFLNDGNPSGNCASEAYIPYLKRNGKVPVAHDSEYYGVDAQAEWAKYLMKQLVGILGAKKSKLSFRTL